MALEMWLMIIKIDVLTLFTSIQTHNDGIASSYDDFLFYHNENDTFKVWHGWLV